MHYTVGNAVHLHQTLQGILVQDGVRYDEYSYRQDDKRKRVWKPTLQVQLGCVRTSFPLDIEEKNKYQCYGNRHQCGIELGCQGEAKRAGSQRTEQLALKVGFIQLKKDGLDD